MIGPEPNHSVSHNPKDLVGTWTLVSVATERDDNPSSNFPKCVSLSKRDPL